ncbi:hypothetical protein [Pseudomonas phage PPAY]|nr:hypothetical protein [Pseudomonas phage PPAY]UCW44432.1 hypothetical protein [Pseudomonas phage PPAT]
MIPEDQKTWDEFMDRLSKGEELTQEEKDYAMDLAFHQRLVGWEEEV